MSMVDSSSSSLWPTAKKGRQSLAQNAKHKENGDCVLTPDPFLFLPLSPLPALAPSPLKVSLPIVGRDAEHGVRSVQMQPLPQSSQPAPPPFLSISAIFLPLSSCSRSDGRAVHAWLAPKRPQKMRRNPVCGSCHASGRSFAFGFYPYHVWAPAQSSERNLATNVNSQVREGPIWWSR